jgi:hypothetical protein
MKKILVLASIAMLAACNSGEPAKTDSMQTSADSTSPASAMKTISSPYQIFYSSEFAMDEPKNAETLLALWKAWDGGDLSAHKDLFADSVEMHFADGTIIHSSRDSVVAMAQKVRDMIASSVSSVNVVMAVKSIDQNSNWAAIWGKEVDTYKNGKIDSANLQETWRFNKDGKADLMFQYKQAAAPPKK